MSNYTAESLAGMTDSHLRRIAETIFEYDGERGGTDTLDDNEAGILMNERANWLWTLAGPLFDDEQRWRCDAQFDDEQIIAFGQTRARAVFIAAILAYQAGGPA